MSSKQNCSNVCHCTRGNTPFCISSHMGKSDFCIHGYLRKAENSKGRKTKRNESAKEILKSVYHGGGAAEVLLILKLLEPLPPSATRGSRRIRDAADLEA